MAEPMSPKDEQRIRELIEMHPALLQPEAIEMRRHLLDARDDLAAARAEVDRLRAELDEIRAAAAGTDVDWLADHVRQAVHYVLGQIEPRLDNKVRAEASEQAAIHIKAGSVPIITDRVVGLAVEYVKKANAERDRLAEQVKGDRLHAVIETALVAYWRLERGKGEPDRLDLAAAGSHAFMLVDALRVAGLPTGREAMHDAHGVGDAVTEALRALDGTEAGQ